MVTRPSFHLFRPSDVPSQTLPSRAANTHRTTRLDKPWPVLIVGIVFSRKRSIPLFVVTQILPSRSSNIPSIELLVSPSRSVKKSILPWCTCARPTSVDEIHRLPSRSRNNVVFLKGGGGDGNGNGSVLPFTNCTMSR